MKGDITPFRGEGFGYGGTYSATIKVSSIIHAVTIGLTHLEPVTKANRPLMLLSTDCNRSIILICLDNLIWFHSKLL